MRQVPYMVEGKLDRTVMLKLFGISDLAANQTLSLWDLKQAGVLKVVREYLTIRPHKPLVALVDLDSGSTGFACAAAARKQWLTSITSSLCFRIAVQEVEAWLLADMSAITAFLGVSEKDYRHIIGDNPETLTDPKAALCQLAAKSVSKRIKRDVRILTGGKEVPAYTSRMIEFAKRHWDPQRAAQRSDSLRRCLRRLREIAEHGAVS